MTSERPGVEGRSRHVRRIVSVASVAVSLALVVPWITSTGTAQEAQPVSLSLLDQTFSVGAGDIVSMTFAVEGDVPRDVLPTTTTTAPPTTTTSTTTTTTPRTATDAGPRSPRPATTSSTTTTTVRAGDASAPATRHR